MQRIFVVPHTHWDREWYLSFEEFRARLVAAVELILETLEGDPDWVFTLDGQAVALEDYLAIQPESEPRLRALVEQGRLSIGPLYVLPDEWLCSAEAACQNLTIGTRICSHLGGASKVGYLPDMFGHVGQMPQILRQAGLEVAVLWRGVDPGEGGLFRWQGEDGSEVLTQFLPRGYGELTHLGANSQELEQRLLARLEEKSPYRGPGPEVLCQGTDHFPILPELAPWLRDLNPSSSSREYHLATWQSFFESLSGEVSPETLPLVQGELRSARIAHLLPGTLSSRYRVKAAHGQAERALLDLTDPALALVASGKGAVIDPTRRLHQRAWKLHLQNLAHDTICGCSVDRVHEEGIVRSHKAEDLASFLGIQALESLAPSDSDGPFQGVLLRSRPGLTIGRRMPVEVDPEVPVPGIQGFPSAIHSLQAGRVLVEEGTHRDFLLENMEDYYRGRVGEFTLRKLETLVEDGVHTLRFHLTRENLLTPDLSEAWAWIRARPETGRFRIELREATRAEVLFLPERSDRLGLSGISLDPSTPAVVPPPWRPLRGGEVLAFEDKQLSVDLSDGSLDLKVGSARLSGLHCFRDIGDRGDEYNHDPVDPDCLTEVENVAVSTRSLGKVGLEIRIRGDLQLPASLNQDRNSRSPERAVCPFESLIRVEAGSPLILFESRLTNSAQDHHLSLVFPTPWKVAHSLAGQPFAEVERAVELPDSRGWIETPLPYFPFQGYFGVQGDSHRLLVLAQDLFEYGAQPTAHGVELGLTLLRSTGWLSRGDLETRRGHAGPPLATPGAQELGEHRFRYALALLPREDGTTGWELDSAFAHAPRVLATGTPRGLEAGKGLKVRGAQVSSFRPAPEGPGSLLRIFNPKPEATTAEILPEAPGVQVFSVNLHAQAAKPLDMVSGVVRYPLGPKSFATLLLKP